MPLIELKSNLSNINYNKNQKSLLDLSSKNIKEHDNLLTPVNIDSTLKENSSNVIDQLDNPIYLNYIDKIFFGARNVGKPLYYTVDYFSARLNETVPIGFSALFNKNNVSLLLSNNQKEIVLRPLTYDVIDINNRKFNFDVQFGIGTNWKSKFINNVGKPIEPITEGLKKTYQNIVNGIFVRPNRQPHKIPNIQDNVKGTEFSLLNNNDYRIKHILNNYNINLNNISYKSIFDSNNDFKIEDNYEGLFFDKGLRDNLNKRGGSWKIKNYEDDNYYNIKSPFILNNKDYFYDTDIIGGVHRDPNFPYLNSILPIDFKNSNLENKYLNESLISHFHWFEKTSNPIINKSFIGEYSENFDYVLKYNINITNSEESIFSNIINEIDDYNLHVSNFDTIKGRIDNEEKIFNYSNLGLYVENSNNFRGLNDNYNLDEYYARVLDPTDSLSIYNYNSNKLDPVNITSMFDVLFNEYKTPTIWSLPRNNEGKIKFNLFTLNNNFNNLNLGDEAEKYIPVFKDIADDLRHSIIDTLRLYMATPLVFNQSWLSAFSTRPETRNFSKVAMYYNPLLNSEAMSIFKSAIGADNLPDYLDNRTLFSGFSGFSFIGDRNLSLILDTTSGLLPIRFGQELTTIIGNSLGVNFLNYEKWLDEVNRTKSKREILKTSDYKISFIPSLPSKYLLYNRKNEYDERKSDIINLKVGGSFKENNESDDNKDLCKLIFEYYEKDEISLSYDHSIQFRSFLESLNEQVTPEWGNTKYVGNPMNVYNYKGVSRKITFSFKVAIFSKREVPFVWEKLNKLMGLCYPAYNDEGRMMAPIIRLTIGDLYYRLSGFLDNITFDVDKNSPWEVEKAQVPMIVTIQTAFTVIGHSNPEMGSHINSSFDMFRKNKVLNSNDSQDLFGNSGALFT